jgi:hypothetical protein
MQARSWIVLRESIYDFIVYEQRNVHAVAVLNDEELLLDFRLVGLLIPLEVVQQSGVGNEKVLDAVRNFNLVNPL